MYSPYILLAAIALLALIAGQLWLAVLVAVVSVYLLFLESGTAKEPGQER